MRRVVVFSFLLLLFFNLYSQIDSTAVYQKTFLQELTEPDSLTNAFIRLYQDERISKLLEIRKGSETYWRKGFRVQLFSSNVPRTSREMAFRVEKKVLQKYPDIEIYVTYSAPFWKVRVGNCFTHEEASDLRKFMAREFPEFQTEMYIVPDQITVN